MRTIVLFTIVILSLSLCACTGTKENIIASKPQRIASQSLEQPIDVLQDSINDSNKELTVIEIEEKETNDSEEKEETIVQDNTAEEYNRNSLENKIEREKKYSTLIDLTLLTRENCDDMIDELERRYDDTLEELDDAEEDLKDAYDELDRQRKQYALAVDSGDERDIDAERDDVYDAEDEVSYCKKEKIDTKKRVDELDNTIKAAEDECKAIDARDNDD